MPIWHGENGPNILQVRLPCHFPSNQLVDFAAKRLDVGLLNDTTILIRSD